LKKFIYVESGTSIIPKNNRIYGFEYYLIKRSGRYMYSYDYQLDEAWLMLDSEYSKHNISGTYLFESENMSDDGRGYICIDGDISDYDITNSRGDIRTLEKAFIDSRVNFFIDSNDVQDEIEDTVAKINLHAGNNKKVFLVLSDTHYVINGNWEYTLSTMREVASKLDDSVLDGVVHLGDFTDGILDKDTCFDYSHRVIDGLKSLNKPLYVALGNHDSNYFRGNPQLMSGDEQKSMYLDNAVLSDDGLQDDSIDMICDGAETYYRIKAKGSNIVMFVLSAYDNSEKNRYGFSEKQIQWVKDSLILYDESDRELDERTRIVILSHDAPLSRLDYWASEIRGGERLCDVLDEWNETHNHRIVGFFHGHTHADYISYERSFPIISIGCSKIEYFEDKKPAGAICPVRIEGKASQELWDTLIIDEISGDVELIRFGAGIDRHIYGQIHNNSCDGDDMNTIASNKVPLIWAHRGASGYAPENTIEAFELAVMLGADGVELDVQFTKDRELVVIHDERIDRVSDGNGYVVDYTLEELRGFNFNKNYPQFGRCAIPTLEEVLILLKDTRLTINIELKTSVNFYPGIEEAVLKLVDKYEMNDRVIYSSFNHESVTRIKQKNETAKCGILYNIGIVDVADYAKRLGIEALHPDSNSTKYESLVASSIENSLDINVWNVNTENEMDKMRQLGINAIITNNPDIARKVYYGEDQEEQKSKAIAKICAGKKTRSNVTGNKNPILHMAGVTYGLIRKPFVALDRKVQKMAGK